MFKRKEVTLLFTVAIAIVALFAHIDAMAAGDCSPDPINHPNTCWNFTLGYTVKVDPAYFGVTETINGKQWKRYSYLVSKTKNTNPNILYAGIEYGVKVSGVPPSNWYRLWPVCVGDNTTSVGVGDCFRQWAAWTPSFPTGLYQVNLYVEPQQKTNTMPLSVKGGSVTGVEWGTILGPAMDMARKVETTEIITTDNEGYKLRIVSTREGELLKVEKCVPPDPTNPTVCDWTDITNQGIDPGTTWFCLQPTSDWLQNSTLTSPSGTAVPLHCGNITYFLEGGELVISNAVTCKYVNGKYRCYPQ
jgi:hypothetical protein